MQSFRSVLKTTARLVAAGSISCLTSGCAWGETLSPSAALPAYYDAKLNLPIPTNYMPVTRLALDARFQRYSPGPARQQYIYVPAGQTAAASPAAPPAADAAPVPVPVSMTPLAAPPRDIASPQTIPTTATTQQPVQPAPAAAPIALTAPTPPAASPTPAGPVQLAAATAQPLPPVSQPAAPIIPVADPSASSPQAPILPPAVTAPPPVAKPADKPDEPRLSPRDQDLAAIHTWVIRENETVRTTLTRWAKELSVNSTWEVDFGEGEEQWDWKNKHGDTITGNIDAALKQYESGFKRANPRPHTEILQNNILDLSPLWK